MIEDVDKDKKKKRLSNPRSKQNSSVSAFLTAAGAYNKRPPNTQSSCRVDRSGILEGASWLLLRGLL